MSQQSINHNTGYSTAHRKAMRARLDQLLGRWLLTSEANELEFLAETLGVPLAWQRYHFNTDQTIGLGNKRQPEGVKQS